MRTALLTALVIAVVATAAIAKQRPDWNDRQIAWKGYKVALLEAKRTRKPICLVFFTTWCPHCGDYSRIFSDRDIVRTSKDFVMVRLNRDRNKGLSRGFNVDGDYIPRTFFLTPDGELVPELIASSGKSRYVYSTTDPGHLLAGMQRALERIDTR